MKKKTIVWLLVVAILSNFLCIASASEPDPNTGESYYILYSEDGEILAYNMPTDLNQTRAEDGTYLKRTVIGTGQKFHIDCGYHPQTGIWRNAERYYFTSSKTVSVGVSFAVGSKRFNTTLEISANVASNVTATMSYKADQNRQSKIRVYSDFDYTVYRGEIRDIYTNQIYQTFEYVDLVKTGEFFKVKYKN